MGDIGSQLHIVKVAHVDPMRHSGPSTIPGHTHLRVMLIDILGQMINLHRIGIPTHQADTCDVSAILGDEAIHRVSIQFLSLILP